ncbi:MAG: type-F conjugative transfer system protein TraW [Thiothrix sp.]|uniref:type-F conjugative transfer system protein TraW n=1 Tax=Thiothrix sp. TaxID=1032 RepID=UPI00261872CA|nr:type-F conjugative transfer system protein TraW [Thiothrix sp.]MDD5394862.1 type-F conjugative transfer system protein TraW [Thiothrix sp.]
MHSACSKPSVWLLPCALLLLLAGKLFAAQPLVVQASTDLGVVGKVYPVAERSFLDVLMQRLQQAQASGELAKIEGDARQKWQSYTQQPPGKHFPRAPKARTRTLDMTLTLDHDLSDQDGNVFAPAGTTINPLAMMQLSKDILLFDATDAAQAAWAKQYITTSTKPVKPILTDGKVLELMQDWKTQLWFDQGGYLAQRFRVEYVPVVLHQRGEMLEMQEVLVHD